MPGQLGGGSSNHYHHIYTHGGVAHLHIHAGQTGNHAATMGAPATGGLASATNANGLAGGNAGAHQFNYVYSDGSEEVESE